MEDEKLEIVSSTASDYVTSAAKAILGSAPFIGSLLVELAGVVIPNQRIDRIARFSEKLEIRLAELEEEFIRSQLSNENFTDLMEEGLRQAARAVSKERSDYIASLIANSLATQDISYIESKHLMRILGEINDVEIIRLAAKLMRNPRSSHEYWEKHKLILEPMPAAVGCAQDQFDKSTLQKSYDEHLTQLGLLRERYDVDPRTKQPVVDPLTGAQKVVGQELSALGSLLLRQIGITAEGYG